MGYRIKVDHSKLESTAKVIDSYTSKMRSQMNNADKAVNEMLGNWKGNDASAFKNQWDKIDDNGSVYEAMRKSLCNYSDFLKYSANKYKTAQINAVNRANKLKRW